MAPGKASVLIGFYPPNADMLARLLPPIGMRVAARHDLIGELDESCLAARNVTLACICLDHFTGYDAGPAQIAALRARHSHIGFIGFTRNPEVLQRIGDHSMICDVALKAPVSYRILKAAVQQAEQKAQSDRAARLRVRTTPLSSAG